MLLEGVCEEEGFIEGGFIVKVVEGGVTGTWIRVSSSPRDVEGILTYVLRFGTHAFYWTSQALAELIAA